MLGVACTRAHAPAAHPWLMEPGHAQCKHSTTVTFNITSASRVWFMIGPDQLLRISHGFSCLLASCHARDPTRTKPAEPLPHDLGTYEVSCQGPNVIHDESHKQDCEVPRLRSPSCLQRHTPNQVATRSVSFSSVVSKLRERIASCEVPNEEQT